GRRLGCVEPLLPLRRRRNQRGRGIGAWGGKKQCLEAGGGGVAFGQRTFDSEQLAHRGEDRGVLQGCRAHDPFAQIGRDQQRRNAQAQPVEGELRSKRGLIPRRRGVDAVGIHRRGGRRVIEVAAVLVEGYDV